MQLIISPLFLFFSVYFYRKHGVLHPGFIFSVIWLVQIIGLTIFGSLFYSIDLITIILLALGSLAFYAGALLGSRFVFIFPVFDRKFRSYPIVFFVLPIAVYAVYKIQSIGSSYIIEDIRDGGMANLRYAITIEREDVYGIFKYIGPIIISILSLLILTGRIGLAGWQRKAYFPILLIFWLLAFVTAFYSSGRGIVVQVLFISMVSALAAKNVRVIDGRLLKYMSFFVGFVVFVFLVMGSFMGKTALVLQDAVNSIALYQFSPIPAFNEFLKSSTLSIYDSEFGMGVFRTPIAVLAGLGLVDPPSSLIQDFVNIPNPTNIYTIYHFYIRQIGFFGIILFPLVTGFFHSVIFNAAFRSSIGIFWKFLFVISLIPLIASVGGDVYFSNLTYHFLLFGVGFLLTKKNRRSKSGNNLR